MMRKFLFVFMTVTAMLAAVVGADAKKPRYANPAQKVVAQGSKLWVNTLWASLCGGYDDDAAYNGDPDEIYGKILSLGTSMIQTDRNSSSTGSRNRDAGNETLQTPSDFSGDGASVIPVSGPWYRWSDVKAMLTGSYSAR